MIVHNFLFPTTSVPTSSACSQLGGESASKAKEPPPPPVLGMTGVTKQKAAEWCLRWQGYVMSLPCITHVVFVKCPCEMNDATRPSWGGGVIWSASTSRCSGSGHGEYWLEKRKLIEPKLEKSASGTTGKISTGGMTGNRCMGRSLKLRSLSTLLGLCQMTDSRSCLVSRIFFRFWPS